MCKRERLQMLLLLCVVMAISSVKLDPSSKREERHHDSPLLSSPLLYIHIEVTHISLLPFFFLVLSTTR